MKQKKPHLARILALSLSIAWLSPSAHATSDTWTGASSAVWATSGNWSTSPATVPGTGDTATFNGAGNANTTITVGTITINTILFDTANAAAYTFGASPGTGAITLNNGGAITVNSAVANNQLVNSNLTLGDDGTTQTFTLTNNSATNASTVAGTVTGSTGAGVKTLAVAGTGITTISGIIGNGTTGTVALTKSDAGTLTLSGLNAFTGGTTVSGGTVNVTNVLNLGAAANALSLNGGTLNAMNGFLNGVRVVTIGASGGTINVGGNGTQQVNFNTAGTLSGNGTLTITGSNIGNANDVRVSTAQTGYTGNIVLQNGGIFEFGATNAVNSTATFNVNSGGELVVNNAVTSANVITVADGGTLSFENGNTGVFSGSTITLSSGTTNIGLRNYYAVNGVTSGTISGKLTGAGGLLINSGGGSGGTLTLSGANDYTGATTANNANITVNGVAGTINTSSGYTLNGSKLTLDYTTATGANNNKLKDTATVTLGSGAELSLTNNTTAQTSETIGGLAIGTGNSIVTLSGSAGGIVHSLVVGSTGFSRVNNGTALIRGSFLGTGATNTTRVMIDGANGTGLTLIGTNQTSGSTSLKIVPYLIGATSVGSTGDNFLTYDTTLGLRTLGSTEQAAWTAGYTTAANPENVKMSTSAGNTTVTLTNASGITVNSLAFLNASTLDSTNANPLTVNSGAVAFFAGSGTTTINSGFSRLNLDNSEGVVTVLGSSILDILTPIDVTQGGTHAANGGLTKAGAGTLRLNVANLYTGQTTVNQGTLAVLAGVNNVFNGTTGTAMQVNNGATFNTNASIQKITTLGLTGNAIVSGTGGVLDLGGTVTYDTSTNPGPGATISVATLNLNGTQIFDIGGAPVQWNPAIYNTTGTKQLTISSAVVNGTGTGGITKNGAGVLVLTAATSANTYSGPTTVNAGTLYYLNSASATIGAPNSDITVNSGATLAAQFGSGTGNLATTIGKSLTLNGANAIMGTNDNPNADDGRQLRYVFTNALTLSSGASTISINNTQNGGFGSNIEFASLSRTAGATVLFRGNKLGAGPLLTNATNNGIRFTTTTPTLTGGGGAIGTTTTSILPYAIGDNGTYQNTFLLTSGLGTDFVTYNGTSVQLLTTYASTITSGASALNNVKVTDTSVTGINAATTINSLILNSNSATVGNAGASSVDGTGTLTLNSGALMVTTTSAANANGGSNGNYGGLYTNNATIGASGLTLDFGAREGIVTTAGSSSLTIAGGITGSVGLTKSGAGVLNLNAVTTYTGDTTVNAGTLNLASTGGMKFIVLGNNVSDKITGIGAVNLNGTFTFALSGASTTIGHNWTIVNVATLTETFGGTFAVAGFAEVANIWTGSANGATYQFTEATGVLQVVPEPSTFAMILGGFGMLLGFQRSRRRRA